MSNSSVWYFDDNGDFVQLMNGTLSFGDGVLPIVDGVLEEPDTPFFRAVAASEQDLLRRYKSGELT